MAKMALNFNKTHNQNYIKEQVKLQGIESGCLSAMCRNAGIRIQTTITRRWRATVTPHSDN